ncbi:hypothetical protein FACS1894147_02510 [Spirochaetia bacterium]|nr:hypothetical protein FACS1894147_02510 [Spirochaetia bacterium]
MNFTSSITLMFKDAFSSGFTQAKNSFAGMTDALGDINKNQSMNQLAAGLAMATSMTEPFRQKLSELMDEPSRLAGQFDSSMRNIQSLTGETNESLAALGKELLAVGAVSTAGPNAIADAYYNIASGIGDTTVRMDALIAANNLAEAGQANLGAATSGLISVVNAYGTSAENMTGLSDVFFQTVKKGVGSLDGFVSSMSSIAGLSASTGIGFDELGSAMAFVTAKGQTEAVAATQLKAAMISFMKPTSEMKAALQSLGIESGSAMIKEYGLAMSMNMLKGALGGSQDKMAKALGSTEALQAAIALTDAGYSEFAQNYSAGLSDATAGALEKQALSYEARVERLQSAGDALKIQIGDDINNIKGFFVDVGYGFLQNFAAPILNSPIGGVFQTIAAGVGVAAKGVLDLGSGALNTASQLVMLTATLQNAGGFTKLFSNSLGLLGSPFKMVGGFALKAIAPILSFGASLWTALAPILPIIAVVAALAVGGYLLIKNWDAVSAFFVNLWGKITGAFSAAFNWIQNLLGGVSNWVLGALAVFMPFIGIPLLIIKNWDTIAAFFVGLWMRITNLFTSVWESIKNFFAGLWPQIISAFTAAWNAILSFFNLVWNAIVQTVVSVANWFSNVWSVVTGAFAAAWTWVSDLFTNIWEGIKGVVLGFVEWLSPVIEAIIAPFKAIGNVIGGIINTVGGWFGATTDMGKSELAKMSEDKVKTATAKPVETANAIAPPTAATSAVAPPVLSDITAAPVSPAAQSGTSVSGGGSMLADHLAAAGRKGIEGTDMTTTASDAFMSAGASVGAIDIADMENEAQVNFAEAIRPAQTQTVQTPWNQPEAKPAKKERPSFNVQNLYLQNEDMKNMYDLYCQLEMVFGNQEEAIA